MNQRAAKVVLQISMLFCFYHAASISHASDFDLSGFATLAVGKVLSGSRDAALADNYACPCFIADYAHGALYGPRATIGQESKVGLQGTYNFTPKWSATAQVVGRGVDGLKADLEWAYLSYAATPNWTLQAGRKRLPLYFYSDFQDVGYAYNWIRPPADVYGWEVVNYNGVNATYRGEIANWAVKSSFFAGKEDSKDNLYSKIYSSSAQDITWKNIRGADLELNRDWLTVRFTYIRNQVQQWDKTDGVRTQVVPDPERGIAAEKQTIYGVAANIDYQNWLARSEYSVFDRSNYSYKANAYMVSGGYRFGKYTPMLTLSNYKERNAFAPTTTQIDRTISLSLRYDVSDASVIKVQYDRFRDKSGPDLDFTGNANLLSVSLDTVF